MIHIRKLYNDLKTNKYNLIHLRVKIDVIEYGKTHIKYYTITLFYNYKCNLIIKEDHLSYEYIKENNIEVECDIYCDRIRINRWGDDYVCECDSINLDFSSFLSEIDNIQSIILTNDISQYEIYLKICYFDEEDKTKYSFFKVNSDKIYHDYHYDIYFSVNDLQEDVAISMIQTYNDKIIKADIHYNKPEHFYRTIDIESIQVILYEIS